jgi:hypothetical protein
LSFFKACCYLLFIRCIEPEKGSGAEGAHFLPINSREANKCGQISHTPHF